MPCALRKRPSAVPRLPHLVMNVPVVENFWTRSLPVSVAYTPPDEPAATLLGSENWPLRMPMLPHCWSNWIEADAGAARNETTAIAARGASSSARVPRIRRLADTLSRVPRGLIAPAFLRPSSLACQSPDESAKSPDSSESRLPHEAWTGDGSAVSRQSKRDKPHIQAHYLLSGMEEGLPGRGLKTAPAQAPGTRGHQAGTSGQARFRESRAVCRASEGLLQPPSHVWERRRARVSSCPISNAKSP